MRRFPLLLALLSTAVSLTAPTRALGIDEFELPPIEYGRATPDNRISRMQANIDAGRLKLRYDEPFGYLPTLLEALEIRPESQTLVFSKTSMQRSLIAPRTPRALYFNDDVYLGYCRHGSVLEISVADPKLGAVFYTLDQTRCEAPRFLRRTDDCLLCHGSSRTDGVPGHLIRSLFVDRQGQPILSQGSRSVDHTTPLEDRWGGWYVTGTHGPQTHLGNLIVSESQGPPPYDNRRGHNLVDLGDRISAGDYLTSHSDITALMVLEHQVLVHNLITQAGYTTRQALHYESEFNRTLGEPPDHRLESTTRRIHNAGDRLLAGFLYGDEAAIRAPIRGSSDFAQRFSQAGPRDRRGRSLRDFDLTTRLFKYPCSYLIYSEGFDKLPAEVKTYVAGRLRGVLTGTDPDERYAHLSPEDRRAILEILEETKPDLWETKTNEKLSGTAR